MELIKNTISTCETVTKGTTQAMADGDVIVPDTKPDILKLLQVDSDACITDKYIENDRLIICGKVNYKVLYIPDGENENIKSIATSMEFRQVVDAHNAKENARILAKPIVDKVEFSTVNSRKLRLRAIIHIDYEICCLDASEITCGIEDECAEKQLATVCFDNTVNISEHDFTVKEMLEVPSGESSVKEILKSDIKICDTEYKPVTGKVIVKGMVAICVLYTNEEDEIRFIEAECPFTEVLDADGVTENSICDIDYSVIGVMCNTEPDIDGDLRELNLDIDICAALKATECIEKELLKDCFVPYSKTECLKNNITMQTTIERPSLQNTIRDSIEIPQSLPAIKSVYNIMTNAIITKSEQQRNKIICEGKVEVYILYLTNTPESPVHSLKKEIPFSYMIECKNETKDTKCEMKCSVKHASYNISSSGEIEVRCLVSVETMLIKELIIENITDIQTDERENRQGIVIYFAHEGERIWDIAKHYGIPCEKLSQHNELTDDVIEAERKIFIPMC